MVDGAAARSIGIIDLGRVARGMDELADIAGHGLLKDAHGFGANDFKIPLHRHANGVESKLADHLGNADALVHPAMLAVDAHLDCVIDRHL